MENPIIQNRTIAIIGGGPGGLTLARLLQQHGALVRVYERDLNKDARVQGATLDLHEDSGLLALQEAGLMDAFKANYRPGADRMRIVDKDAAILFDDAFSGEEDQLQRPEIDRGPLRKILLDSLEDNTVVWDSQFLSMEKAGTGWKLTFQNGTTAFADIVIAADGANSKIRPFVTPLKPFYSGITIVEGSVYNSEKAVPEIHQLLNGGKIFALGNEKTLIVSSKGDGSLVFYTACKTDQNWAKESGIDFTDKVQVKKWFVETFPAWTPVWQELFEQAEPAFVVRPQYCMPLDQSWEPLPNLTILGDAAHLMPPYAGEGVNMAMLDALQLSQCLLNTSFTTVQDAIAHYEKQMLARFAEIGKITLEQTAALHSPDAIAHMLKLFSGEDQ